MVGDSAEEVDAFVQLCNLMDASTPSSFTENISVVMLANALPLIHKYDAKALAVMAVQTVKLWIATEMEIPSHLRHSHGCEMWMSKSQHDTRLDTIECVAVLDNLFAPAWTGAEATWICNATLGFRLHNRPIQPHVDLDVLDRLDRTTLVKMLTHMNSLKLEAEPKMDPVDVYVTRCV